MFYFCGQDKSDIIPVVDYNPALLYLAGKDKCLELLESFVVHLEVESKEKHGV